MEKTHLKSLNMKFLTTWGCSRGCSPSRFVCAHVQPATRASTQLDPTVITLGPRPRGGDQKLTKLRTFTAFLRGRRLLECVAMVSSPFWLTVTSDIQ